MNRLLAITFLALLPRIAEAQSTHNSDSPYNLQTAMAPTPNITTTYSGVLGAANLFQQIVPAVNPDEGGFAHPARIGDGTTRRACRIYNSGTTKLSIFFGPPASAMLPAIPLSPGASLSCVDGAYVIEDAISLAGPVGAPFFIEVEY